MRKLFLIGCLVGGVLCCNGASRSEAPLASQLHIAAELDYKKTVTVPAPANSFWLKMADKCVRRFLKKHGHSIEPGRGCVFRQLPDQTYEVSYEPARNRERK